MALDPQVIIADEPVSMLDISIKASVLHILLQLREEYRISIILITHDLAVASYLTDRLAVMYLGKIVEVGPTELIVNKPLHPYTQGLIDSVPSPNPLKTGRRSRIKGEPPSPINLPTGCRFQTRCPHIMKICLEGEIKLRELEKDRQIACLLYN